MPRHFEILQAVTAEIASLAKQQITAAKDASFRGWEPADATAYEDRSQRLAVLRSALADIARMPDAQNGAENMDTGLGNDSP